jgi:hypothetical protein
MKTFFSLNPREKEKADDFYKKCKELLNGEDVRLSYHFYPTGIGNKIVVKSERLGVELDVSDYGSW